MKLCCTCYTAGLKNTSKSSHLALRFLNFCQCFKASLLWPKGQYSVRGCEGWAWVLKVMSKKPNRICADFWNQETGETKQFWKPQSLTAHLKSEGYGLNNLVSACFQLSHHTAKPGKPLLTGMCHGRNGFSWGHCEGFLRIKNKTCATCYRSCNTAGKLLKGELCVSLRIRTTCLKLIANLLMLWSSENAPHPPLWQDFVMGKVGERQDARLTYMFSNAADGIVFLSADLKDFKSCEEFRWRRV